MERYKCDVVVKKKKKEKTYTFKEVQSGSAPEGVYKRNVVSDDGNRVVIFGKSTTNPVVLFISSYYVEPLDTFGTDSGFVKTDEIFKCSFGELS